MKSILISIQHKWVAKILNGEKIIEVRKRFPLDYRGWVYIYCTKGTYLLKTNKGYVLTRKPLIVGKDSEYTSAELLNGKVVARFYCDEVYTYDIKNRYTFFDFYFNETCEKLMGICSPKLYEYVGDKVFYGIHISQLEIFDKPKELSDFFKVGVNKWYNEHAGTDMPYLEFWNTFDDFRITKAPQSWQYIEEVE